ncbi:hypothetical protein [Trueperella pecoris]|uniref:hypothetical protein n=1 Tax=Trueperella pecoris TaxID=2733571 RepID=UPI00186BA25E|nr:hypothetical protein [Trueperella pecoris]QOQ38660.1 hypothetical protein HLG82_03825 [Trueperella pecoris]
MRNFTAPERRFLDFLIDVCEPAEGDVVDREFLRGQIPHLTAEEGCDVPDCPCLNFAYDGVRVWDHAGDKAFPAWRGGVDEYGNELGPQAPERVVLSASVWNSNVVVLLFIDNGMISFLEFASADDDYPRGLPDLGNLLVEPDEIEPSFTPWPIHAAMAAPDFPPGLFRLSRNGDLFHAWFDELWSFDILPLDRLYNEREEGPTFSVMRIAKTDIGNVLGEGSEKEQLWFHGTNFHEPWAATVDILARYSVDDDVWYEGPHPGFANGITKQLASLLRRHRNDQPQRLYSGEVLIETVDRWTSVAHAAWEGGLVRFIEIETDWDWETNVVQSRSFNIVVTLLNGDGFSATLAVSDVGVIYAESMDGDPEERDDGYKALIVGLAPLLWNGGRRPPEGTHRLPA